MDPRFVGREWGGGGNGFSQGPSLIIFCRMRKKKKKGWA